MKNKTVVVGMSGGVDSSVAAYLLKEQGYNVIGVTMQIWQPEDTCQIEREGGCCGLSAVEDARRVAAQLDIPYYVMNFRDEFQKNVIDYFVKEYRMGHTPNPCIACNRYVKWESLLKKSLAIGADYIATGHYAKIRKLENGRYTICRSDSQYKDQTYALYNLTQHQLKHTLFPLGSYEKNEVRQLAEQVGLLVARKPDSQEICFVPDGDYATFIEQETGKREVTGNFVDEDGIVLGQHKGISHYTVGQRKGLGIAFGTPLYVVSICPQKNEVVLGPEQRVFSKTLYANELNCMATDHFTKGEHVFVKIRYSDPGCLAVIDEIDENDEQMKLVFERPVRAVTKGQAVVMYDENGNVLGGGTIVD